MSEPTQSFSVRQLGWMRRWHSQAHLRTSKGSRPISQQEWRDFLTDVAKSISDDAFSFDGLKWHSVRRKRALSTKYLEDALVIRKINDNIRRAYGITQPNRATLIKTAMQALAENSPKTVLRIDLRSCFESINRQALVRELKLDAKLSAQTTALLESLFARAAKKLPSSMPEGIPRGLTVSTSLAELKLRRLDLALRKIPGTYLLLRFVDDILIFSTELPEKAMEDAIKVIGQAGFRVNSRKTSAPIRIACKCEQTCPHGNACPCKKACVCLASDPALTELEYLGYKLLFAKHNEKERKTRNGVYCVLSDRKSNRIKTRIVKAITDCDKVDDWKMLEDRMKYLSGNQRVAAHPDKRGLFNGLAYTHGAYWPPPGPPGSGSIEEIDRFYKMALRRILKKKGVTPFNLGSLERISFASGFAHKRRTKFAPIRVDQIQSCWK